MQLSKKLPFAKTGLEKDHWKRTIRRYDYSHFEVENVTLETAGTLDMDIELKFCLGENAYRVLTATAEMHKLSPVAEDAVVKSFNALLDNLNHTVLDRFTRRDYGRVFEKYIHS